jgi:hypothetical protein
MGPVQDRNPRLVTSPAERSSFLYNSLWFGYFQFRLLIRHTCKNTHLQSYSMATRIDPACGFDEEEKPPCGYSVEKEKFADFMFIFLQTPVINVVKRNCYLPCKISIHLMASVSLIFPRYIWVVFRSRCLRMTLEMISKGTPFLLAYVAECRRRSWGDILTLSFLPSPVTKFLTAV